MADKCSTCFHGATFLTQESTVHCSGCCAFSRWVPMKDEVGLPKAVKRFKFTKEETKAIEEALSPANRSLTFGPDALTGNGGSHDAIASFPFRFKSPDANVEAIRNKLLERSEVGLKKYGVTTERDDLNLVQWLTHLQEELLDGVVYIEAALKQLREKS